MKREHAVRGVCMRVDVSVALLHSLQRRERKQIRQKFRTAARMLARFKRNSAQCPRVGSRRCYTRPINDTCRPRALTLVRIASASVPQPHMPHS